MRLPHLLFFLSLSLLGCASVDTVSVAKLKPMQTSSSFHPLFYTGSDSKYHYFSYLNVKIWQDYRVPINELIIKDIFKPGERNAVALFPGDLEKMQAN